MTPVHTLTHGVYIDVVTIADVPDNYDERSASSNGTTPMIVVIREARLPRDDAHARLGPHPGVDVEDGLPAFDGGVEGDVDRGPPPTQG